MTAEQKANLVARLAAGRAAAAAKAKPPQKQATIRARARRVPIRRREFRFF